GSTWMPKVDEPASLPAGQQLATCVRSRSDFGAARRWTCSDGFSIVRPANDDFASATPITTTSASIAATTTGATIEAGELPHDGVAGGARVWYQWRAGDTGRATISTQGSSYDTVLAVYTGTAVNALTPIASNDDYVNSTSQVTFAATVGT